MSRYGINFYGPGTFYGEAPLIEFDARPMSAYSREHGQMTVSWHTPSGAWDRLRLTRDPSGFAPRADMGTLLVDSPKAGAPTTYDDLSGLSQGKFYYYTVWVRATLDQQWRRAGDVIALVTQDWGYSGRMYELIPGVYRDRDMDTPSYRLYDRGDLARFLDIPGFEADHIRSEYETLKWVNDPDRVSGGLLPLMAKQLGFGYEGELGMRLARQQMKNAVYIYKHKGTQLGIEALASVLTGWAPTVTVGKNLVLDQNDSSFEEGTGQWVNVTNATLSRRSTTDASAPGVIAGPVDPPPGASTGDIGSGSWMLLLTAIGAGDMTVQSFATGTAFDNRTKSIPVAADTQYTLSVYSRALDVAADAQIGVEWFTITGASLGAVAWDTAATNATGAWTRMTSTVTSPATAAFLRVSLRVQGAAAGNRHVFDALQVEAAGAATAYQSARSIRIVFAADRINLIPNAGAEVNVNGWTATNTSTFARSTDQFQAGTSSFALVSASDAAVSMISTEGTGGMPVIAGRFYTASGYLFKASGTARSFRLSIRWYDDAGAVISTADGALVTQTINAWTRAFVTALAPATAAYAAVLATVTTTETGETQYFDSFLMESGQSLREYFDGTTQTNEGEYMWQSGGTPAQSPSYYYSRRLVKNYRLNARMAEFLPAGSTYALLYAGAA